MSPHVVPKASLVSSTAIAADEEKTAVDSSFEDEQSTIDQAEMADKVRRALAEKRRLGTANAGGAAPPIPPPVSTTNAAAITSSAPIIPAPPALVLPSSSPSTSSSIPPAAASPLSIPTPTFASLVPSPPHVATHQAPTIPPAHASSPLSIPTPGTIPNPIIAPLMGSGGASSGASSIGATTGNTTTGGHPLEEPTVEDRQRPNLDGDVLGVARLVIEAGPDVGKDYQLRSGKPILVGRAMDNHVVLTDLSVSRKHLEILWEGTHWMLSDRGSGNGTLLNGKLEEGSFRLFNGDRIEIGHTTFLFEQQGQEGRNQWGDEEPSTIAGRRGTPVPGRPSAVRTTEYEVHPAESAAISMVERKPLPLPRPGAAAPQASPFLAPTPLGAVPMPHSDPRFPTAPITRPPKSPPNGSFPQNQNNLAGLGNGMPASLGAAGLGNGMPSTPALPLGAPARSSPMNTLPGRPPIIGPTAPPAMGDGLVPPRHVSVAPEMVPLMQTMPQPRLLNNGPVPVGGAIGRPPPSSPMQRPVVARPMAVPDLAVDSGIAVSPDPRFQNRAGRQSGGAVALEEDVPRLTGRAKATVALVAGGAVLLVAVIALAMSSSGDPLPTPTTAAAPDPAVEPSPTVAVEPSPAVAPTAPPQKTAAELEAEKAAADKAEAERLAADKLAADKAEAERIAADKLAADKLAADKLAADKAEEAAKQAAAKQAAADKAEQEAAKREAAKQAAADKAAAAKAAKLAAAEKAAAARAAKLARNVKTAPSVAATRVAAAEPAGDLDTEAVLGKAEDLYRKKNFTGAAQAIRDALRGRSGYDDLRSTAQIYESLHRTYTAGTAVGAKPTDAYTNLRSASRYDDKLGKAHAEDIGPRVTTLAPRAAAQFLASKQYEEAFQALRDAERAGASSSTLNAVRTAVEAHANDLFNQAQAKRESEPSAARALFKKVLKLVEPGSSLHSRATTAFNELK